MADKRIRVDTNRLETLMEMRGYTSVELAERVDMHPNGILKIKREQSTTFATLEKLCRALECHPFDLIVAEGYPEPFLDAPVNP